MYLTCYTYTYMRHDNIWQKCPNVQTSLLLTNWFLHLLINLIKFDNSEELNDTIENPK